MFLESAALFMQAKYLHPSRRKDMTIFRGSESLPNSKFATICDESDDRAGDPFFAYYNDNLKKLVAPTAMHIVSLEVHNHNIVPYLHNSGADKCLEEIRLGG